MVSVTASGLSLHKTGVLAAFRKTLADLCLPSQLADVATALLHFEPSRRITPSVAADRIGRTQVSTIRADRDPLVIAHRDDYPVRPAPDDLFIQNLRDTEQSIREYICANISYSRMDRLWPSSPEVFTTNPVSLRFGAAGVGLYLLHTTNSISDDIVQWVLDRITPDTQPMGLYSGLAGTALFLLAAGRFDAADAILAHHTLNEKAFNSPGLYEGAAGWALAHLHFWLHTRDHSYLERSLHVAARLETLAQNDGDALYWTVGEKTPVGLGRGASGIALLYVYLYAITGDRQHLSLAKRALAFDMAQASFRRRHLLIPEHVTDDSTMPVSPHTLYGTAGVGTAALRVYAATHDEQIGSFARLCCSTLSSRYTNKLWQDWGLAGYGEFLLDASQYLDIPHLRNTAFYVADGILPYAIQTPEGVAFPGSELLRISCDYGLGGAGIGMFFHRLLRPDSGRIMFLDQLLAPRFPTVPV